MKIEDIVFISVIIVANIIFSFYLINEEEIKEVRHKVEEAPEVVREELGVPSVYETIRKLQKGARDAFD